MNVLRFGRNKRGKSEIEMVTETSAEEMIRKELYDSSISNIQDIGGKKYASVSVKALLVDSDYQRDEFLSHVKVSTLIYKWNPNKMDALRVSNRKDEKAFAVIDGCHRLLAAKYLGMKYVPCEILDLSDDPKQRQIEEARLFATQNDELDKLTPLQKHKANCLCGVKENLFVQKMIEKYDIKVKTNCGRGYGKIGELTGFSQALKIAKANEKLLDHTLNILYSARWNISHVGLGNFTLSAVSNVLRLHAECTEDVKEILINSLIKITPEQFIANSRAKYPERKDVEAITLTMEDIVCEVLGIPRVYNGGNVKAAMIKVA